MTTSAYKHLIEVCEEDGVLTIYRVTASDHQLFTSVELPKRGWNEDPEGIREFCRMLGENILADSPQARKLLKI